jgi:SAM-dependent methyltransferase
VTNQDATLSFLEGRPQLLKAIELLGPRGQSDTRRSKKLQEVAGFGDVIRRYVRQCLAKKETVRLVDFSCGKSYLGIALALALTQLDGKKVELVGVDVNGGLIEKCGRVAQEAGLQTARFVASRTLDFEDEGHFDLVVALHACDTATDEAIAKGIQFGAELILTVPCCQNQIRGQIVSGHPLTAMTEFGPIRYRLANMLTDVLRAQFLRSAGYFVELTEIASPRLTPKNLCICARKVRRSGGRRRDEGYRTLKSFFDVKPKVEQFCPGIIGDDRD